MFKEFLDLGRHPIANAFLNEEDFKDEFLFDLKVCWDEETKLVSIKEFVEPEKIFNEDYPYNTSNSFPMIEHFKNTAEMLKMKFKPSKVLEIGSNSGPFIENFDNHLEYKYKPPKPISFEIIKKNKRFFDRWYKNYFGETKEGN